MNDGLRGAGGAGSGLGAGGAGSGLGAAGAAGAAGGAGGEGESGGRVLPGLELGAIGVHLWWLCGQIL